MKFEKFEQESMKEIEMLKALSFKKIEAPEFVAPSYGYVWGKVLPALLLVPALAIVFGLFINVSPQNTATNKDLSLIEESNSRILDQIDTLDNNDSKI
jgi:hypothetical protein